MPPTYKDIVNQSPNKIHGLMPILEDGAPEIYEKIWRVIESCHFEKLS
jgi:hypothetical protein